jgi:hypothetical protein
MAHGKQPMMSGMEMKNDSVLCIFRRRTPVLCPPVTTLQILYKCETQNIFLIAHFNLAV